MRERECIAKEKEKDGKIQEVSFDMAWHDLSEDVDHIS
jgi:hypothetical protein